MVPHEKYSDLEDSDKIIHDRYDPKQNKMMSPEEKVAKDNEKAQKDHAEMMAKPQWEVPSRMVDDWTGSKFADNLYTYGHPKELPKGDPTFMPAKDPEAKEKDYTPEKTPKEENKAWEEKMFPGEKEDCCKKEEAKEEKKLAQIKSTKN